MNAQHTRGNRIRVRWTVFELVVVLFASLGLDCLIIFFVLPTAWTAHVWIGSFALVAGLVLPVGASLSVLHRAPVFLTMADRVTLGRGVLAGGCATLAVLVWGGVLSPQTWLLVLLAAPATALDAVDGWVARRTRTSNAYGARLDMETDAAFLMILSIPAAFVVGHWVLLIGAMRYLFVAVAWWRPALKKTLAFSHFRRNVAGFQAIALVAVVIPVLPVSLSQAIAAAALGLLLISFGKDVVTLEKAHEVG